jgi:hypothetical protein
VVRAFRFFSSACTTFQSSLSMIAHDDGLKHHGSSPRLYFLSWVISPGYRFFSGRSPTIFRFKDPDNITQSILSL